MGTSVRGRPRRRRRRLRARRSSKEAGDDARPWPQIDASARGAHRRRRKPESAVVHEERPKEGWGEQERPAGRGRRGERTSGQSQHSPLVVTSDEGEEDGGGPSGPAATMTARHLREATSEEGPPGGWRRPSEGKRGGSDGGGRSGERPMQRGGPSASQPDRPRRPHPSRDDKAMERWSLPLPSAGGTNTGRGLRAMLI